MDYDVIMPSSAKCALTSTGDFNSVLTVKGQIISKCPYEIIVYPKNSNEKNSEITALASKERSNQKNKGTLLY